MKIYIARQPIYDLNNRVFGYELLYRSGMKNEFNSIDGDQATCSVISDTLTTFGLNTLTNGRMAFINFTRSLLMSNILDLLHPKDFIIEILEDTFLDQELLDCIEEKTKQGYIFAMDDYIGEEKLNALLPFSEIVKVDFRILRKSQRKKIIEKLRPLGKTLLAEKIETEDEYKEARHAGYTLFQGYYFSRPMILCSDAPMIQNSTCIRMFQELSQTEVSLNKLGQIIRTDINLTYRLLAHANTLQYYRGHTIRTIQMALMRMGLKEVRRWLTLIFIRDFTINSSDQNVKLALSRGLFSERIAEKLCIHCEEDAFMTGILSMLENIVDGKMSELLKDICVSDAVREALSGRSCILNSILKFIKAYEDANWDAVQDFINERELNAEAVAQDYIEALEYADQMFC